MGCIYFFSIWLGGNPRISPAQSLQQPSLEFCEYERDSGGSFGSTVARAVGMAAVRVNDRVRLLCFFPFSLNATPSEPQSAYTTLTEFFKSPIASESYMSMTCRKFPIRLDDTLAKVKI
jgi:hypothetical protein